MKSIKVLGSGCRSCVTTAEMIAAEAKSLGIGITMEKVTDMAEILGYGVMSTPGVVVNGTVVHAGGIPTAEKVRAWLNS